MMKKAISLLLLAICVCGMMGCEKAAGPEVEINYGNSSVYSKEEIDEAIEIIQEASTSENASAVWNPDTDYKDYQWWLARTSDNSEWQLVTWGYC